MPELGQNWSDACSARLIHLSSGPLSYGMNIEQYILQQLLQENYKTDIILSNMMQCESKIYDSISLSHEEVLKYVSRFQEKALCYVDRYKSITQ